MNKQLIKTTTDVNGKTLGMAWYNFLVRFALIASAIINFLFSLTYLTGTIYNGQLTAEEVYSYYGETLRAVDILFGLFMIGFGVLAIIVRNKLAKYESDAPKFVYILYALSAGLPFVYSVTVAIITSQFITLNAIITLISGLVILFLNIKYFSYNLFVIEVMFNALYLLVVFVSFTCHNYYVALICQSACCSYGFLTVCY